MPDFGNQLPTSTTFTRGSTYCRMLIPARFACPFLMMSSTSCLSQWALHISRVARSEPANPRDRMMWAMRRRLMDDSCGLDRGATIPRRPREPFERFERAFHGVGDAGLHG